MAEVATKYGNVIHASILLYKDAISLRQSSRSDILETKDRLYLLANYLRLTSLTHEHVLQQLQNITR